MTHHIVSTRTFHAATPEDPKVSSPLEDQLGIRLVYIRPEIGIQHELK